MERPLTDGKYRNRPSVYVFGYMSTRWKNLRLSIDFVPLSPDFQDVPCHGDIPGGVTPNQHQVCTKPGFNSASIQQVKGISDVGGSTS